MDTFPDCTAEVLDAAGVIWRYLRLIHEPEHADFILCLGCNDPGVARHAACLWHQGWASRIVMSGGLAHQNDFARTGWERPEAEVFAEAAVKCGVPREVILLENRATHTGENFAMTRALLATLSLPSPKRLLVVAKPYMTRRGFVTGGKVWHGVELRMQCERVDLETYLERWPELGLILNLMAGDLHRIMMYPLLGFQIRQEIPEGVLAALECLVSAGFGKHLVASHSPWGEVLGTSGREAKNTGGPEGGAGA